MVAMNVVLISTYDMGRQPFGLASPAAWLRQAGVEVATLDLSQDNFSRDLIEQAHCIAFHLPMHTATRLAIPRIEAVRQWNPAARLICYGLYAPANAELLRGLGVAHIIGGEFEAALVDAVLQRAESPDVLLDRLAFVTPDRTSLPVLNGYARMQTGGAVKLVGYTEASRGCKHLCRHCPVVPVYNGRFRIVPRDVVLADIRQQVAAGARHISFGDPDFFNGPGHATRLVEALHSEFPDLTYDVTIKVEHLLQHRGLLPTLRRTGCAWITSAVESLDDVVLDRFAKGHTRAGFIAAVDVVRDAGLLLSPTFVTFTPWTTQASYIDLLTTLRDLDLVGNVAPIQLAIRLLIPKGSLLLDLPEVSALVKRFDAEALVYPWLHPDPEMDRLCRDLQTIFRLADKQKLSRQQTFAQIWQRATGTPPERYLPSRATIPYLTEPWYC